MLAAMLFVFSIALLVTTDITKRFFFGQGLGASVEISELLIAVGVAFGFAWAQIQREHVSTEFVFRRFSPRWQAITAVFDWSFSFLFTSFLLYASWSIAWERFLGRETHFAGTMILPIWPARFLFAAGVTLLWLVLLQDVIAEISSVVRERREI